MKVKWVGVWQGPVQCLAHMSQGSAVLRRRRIYPKPTGIRSSRKEIPVSLLGHAPSALSSINSGHQDPEASRSTWTTSVYWIRSLHQDKEVPIQLIRQNISDLKVKHLNIKNYHLTRQILKPAENLWGDGEGRGSTSYIILACFVCLIFLCPMRGWRGVEMFQHS